MTLPTLEVKRCKPPHGVFYPVQEPCPLPPGARWGATYWRSEGGISAHVEFITSPDATMDQLEATRVWLMLENFDLTIVEVTIYLVEELG